MSQQQQDTSRLTKRPAIDDHAAWHTYWQTQDQPWRTEPEISIERQEVLEKRRTIVSNIEQGIYPFKGMKLERADVEWLLATHEHGRGPIIWSNETERKRKGLDMRGADLCQVDLSSLPLSCLRGSLTMNEWLEATEEERAMAIVHMGNADLSGAKLEGANLIQAKLEGADLRGAELLRANLSRAKLKGANLERANLLGANLNRAKLKGANLIEAKLEGANLIEAKLEGANLSWAKLERADLIKAKLEGANLSWATLVRVNLIEAKLEGANLSWAKLERANLMNAELERANLMNAELERANLSGANLEGANLRNVILADKSRIGPWLADVQWGSSNLSVVNWTQVAILGDEYEAQQKKTPDGVRKHTLRRLNEYQTVVRANRQLAVALQAQGLNEEAARFAYRAQRLQRSVLRRRYKFVSYLFSGFLDLIAGYGYKPGRSVFAYLLLIAGFALAFYSFGHLTWYEALIVSLTAFHGRGFFSQQYQPGNPQSVIAAIEAVAGLLIEISFIATFTQRFFGK